jgi:hypothetical protein
MSPIEFRTYIEYNDRMSVIAESTRNIQKRVSEGFCREINKLDVAARLHAIELIVDSLKKQGGDDDDVPHLTDLRGIGRGTWGNKDDIDKFLREERDSWDF